MNYFNAISKFDSITRSIQGSFGILVMILCACGIFALAVFLVLKKIGKPAAVIIQTAATILLMMPIMWGLNNYVRSKVGPDENILIDTINEQEKKISELQTELRIMQSTAFSLQQLQVIHELGLLQTDLQQTVLYKKVFDDTHRGFWPGSKYDLEYLGVVTNNMTVKFGVDLKTVRCYYASNKRNTIMVYGVQSKFIGVSNSSPVIEVSEVRRLILDGDNNVTDTRIDNSKEARIALSEQERKMNSEYMERLNKGMETEFMNNTVEKLAENFIKNILAPLGKEVVFTDINDQSSLPFTEFITLEN